METFIAAVVAFTIGAFGMWLLDEWLRRRERRRIETRREYPFGDEWKARDPDYRPPYMPDSSDDFQIDPSPTEE